MCSSHITYLGCHFHVPCFKSHNRKHKETQNVSNLQLLAPLKTYQLKRVNNCKESKKCDLLTHRKERDHKNLCAKVRTPYRLEQVTFLPNSSQVVNGIGYGNLAEQITAMKIVVRRNEENNFLWFDLFQNLNLIMSFSFLKPSMASHR